MRLPAIGLAALSLAVSSGAAENPVAWSFENAPKAVKTGETFTLRLRAQIQPGWHLYAMDLPEGGPIPTGITLADDSLFELGAVTGSKAHQIFDPNFNMQVAFYTEKAEFRLPVKVRGEAPANHGALVVEARYQTCNDKICLPPKKVKMELPLDVRAR